MLEIGRIREDWREDYNCSIDGVAEEIATLLEDIKDRQQESLDNIPEQLQEGDTGMMLYERIEGLENAISELDNFTYSQCEEEAEEEVLSEMGEYDPDNGDYDSKADYNEDLDERKAELAEEKYGDYIDEALSNIIL